MRYFLPTQKIKPTFPVSAAKETASNSATPRIPPGPRTPATIQTLRFLRNPLKFFTDCQNRYGPAVSIRLLGIGDVIWIADPATVKKIFAMPEILEAGKAAKRPLEPVVGANSILTLDGPEHLRQRRLLLPPLHGQAIKQYSGVIIEVIENEMRSWPNDVPFPLRPRMQAVTLEVILRVVFGIHNDAQRSEFSQRIREITDLANIMILPEMLRRDFGRLSPGGRYARRLRALNQLIYREITARRTSTNLNDAQDVLSLLLQARDENDRPMHDSEIRDELVSLLVAGHETTATALAWIFDLLLHHPQAFLRARDAALNNDSSYLDAAIKESLRLRPVVFVNGRIAQREIQLGTHLIPAGTRVWVPMIPIHLDPTLHKQPNDFRPERFLDGEPKPNTWIPFGGGIRRCIGAAFASLEMRLILQAILTNLSVYPATSRQETAFLHGVTLVPKTGTKILIHPRVS